MIGIFAGAGVCTIYTMYMSIICIERLNTHVAADDKVGLNNSWLCLHTAASCAQELTAE